MKELIIKVLARYEYISHGRLFTDCIEKDLADVLKEALEYIKDLEAELYGQDS